MHLHLGRSRDGASLTLSQIHEAMDAFRIERAVLFTIDETSPGPTYEKSNRRVLRAASTRSRLIPFTRLNPRAKEKAFKELRRCCSSGVRGVKLHPRSENFSPQHAETLIDEIENSRLPVILHTSHEPNCRPLEWERIFRRHAHIPFILAHAGKDAFEEAIAVACRNRHVWLETSTLSYWRTGMILRKLGARQIVFGSDLPYSHPGVERFKLELLLSLSDQRKVYLENPKRILGE